MRATLAAVKRSPRFRRRVDPRKSTPAQRLVPGVKFPDVEGQAVQFRPAVLKETVLFLPFKFRADDVIILLMKVA